MVGIILAIVGLAGLLLNYTGAYPMSGVLGDLKLWGGVTLLGVIVWVFTRRPRD